ncbi:MAG: DUF3576 domain-containing protein [Rhodospirillales bacterium]|nr:DUF3576 domain-containing protein [Rhodospirillales bacterium]
MNGRVNGRALLALVGAAFLLVACGESEAVYPDKGKKDTSPVYSNQKKETIFGPGGLFSTEKRKRDDEGGGIGVNAFLWRATLDTFAFMPLASADPFGGVVITDWYAPPETPNERFKTTVYILDKVLRADGVRVALFRQVRDGAGTWNDAPVDVKTVTDLENAVLTRARQLRMASAER